jgi:putative transposase
MNEENPFRKAQGKCKDAARERSAGVPPAGFLGNQRNRVVRNRGHLPHWEATAATYFVTFHLADSLPQEALKRIFFSRRDIPATAAKMGRSLTEVEKRRLVNLHTRRVENFLDSGAGACSLKNDTIAKLVADSLREFDGERYRLFAWCVMPNHVHAVFQTLSANKLPGILHSWKSFSAKRAN